MPTVPSFATSRTGKTLSSYSDLIQILREGGFTPLHYEAGWVLGRFTTLSPLVMLIKRNACSTRQRLCCDTLARGS